MYKAGDHCESHEEPLLMLVLRCTAIPCLNAGQCIPRCRAEYAKLL
jgi:hypothetical protein